MSSEIMRSNTLDVAYQEQNDDELSERALFARRVLAEPGLRHQITELRKRIHTNRVADLGLGYSQFPFVQVSEVLHYMNLDHTSGNYERHAIARALLDGCLEARDNLEKSSDADEIDISGNALTRLPFELQLVAIAKAFSGDTGGVFYASSLQAGSSRLELLLGYAQQKLGLSPSEAEYLRQAVTVVNGSEIVEEVIRYKWWDQPIDKGVFPPAIVGRPAPNEGYYLPDMAEEAIRGLHYSDGWMARHQDKSAKVAVDSLKMGEVIADLCGFDEDTASFWGAYGMSSLLLEEVFIKREEGYSGAIGQLASWQTMCADEEFYGQYTYIRDHLETLSTNTEFSREGMRLAICSMAQRIARKTEAELVSGGNQNRSGRLRTIGTMYADVLGHDGNDLAERILASAPLLSSHIREAADPWTYRYS